ncbi:MAG TPA: flagellar protein FliS [Terriglobales bacterium]|jgi:flagellar protein FliS
MKDPQTIYREAALRGATPVGLVVLLYEQAVQDLQRALTAIGQNNIQQRTREINHAIAILGQLNGTLDMENGGQVASNLRHFYEQAKNNLVLAQAQVSPEIIRGQITDLLELREAWCEVNHRLEQATNPGMEPARQSPAESPEMEWTSTKWTM